jgi:microsomal epoxide hydrolase
MYRTPQDEGYLRQVTEWSLSMPTDAMMAAMVGGLTNDNRDALAKLDRPTLLAVTRSPYLPLYEDMRDRIEGVRYEVLDAGHALFIDQPERFNRLVEELLSGGGATAEETASAAEGGR